MVHHVAELTYVSLLLQAREARLRREVICMCQLGSCLDIPTAPSQLTSLSTDVGKPRYFASLNTNIVSEAMSVREQSAGLSKSRWQHCPSNLVLQAFQGRRSPTT